MDKKFNHIIKSAKSVMLSQVEKQDVWSAVDAHVRSHRAYKPVISRPRHAIFSPYFIHTQRLAVFGLAVLFVIGGGTSIAAQGALPNDALYAIKVNVNEEVQSWFTFGAESRAYFETKRAGERLEEAKTLAVLGELDAESQEKIKKNFEKHAHKVQEQIATIEANNDLKVAINVSENFEQSLKEHTKSLVAVADAQAEAATLTEAEDVIVATTLSENTETVPEDVLATRATRKMTPSTEDTISPVDTTLDTTVSTEISTDVGVDSDVPVASMVAVEPNELTLLVSTVEENITASAAAREEVEAKISTVADTQTRKDVALDKQKDAVDQIEKVKVMIASSTAPQNTILTASTTVATAEKIVEEGDVKLEQAQYSEAFTLFKQGYETGARAEYVLTASTTKPTTRSTIKVR